MMQKLKTSKRRTVQKVLHAQGKADYTLHDPEYELAVQRFHGLEKQFTSILHKLKEARKVTERYSATHAALGSYFSIPFSNPGSHDAHTHDAFRLADCLTKAHEPTTRSCMVVLQKRGIDELETILATQFPARKHQIVVHAGLLTDVESYRRRIKALQDKGREGHDAAFVKLTRKLENTQLDYNTKHQELLHDLNAFYNDRFRLLEPIFGAFLATQFEFHGFPYERMCEFLSPEGSAADQVELARANIRDLVERGGPGLEKPKPRAKLFTRLHTWTSSKRSEGALAANPQPTAELPSPGAFSPPGSAASAAHSARFSSGQGEGHHVRSPYEDYVPNLSPGSIPLDHDAFPPGSARESNGTARGSTHPSFESPRSAQPSPQSSRPFSEGHASPAFSEAPSPDQLSTAETSQDRFGEASPGFSQNGSEGFDDRDLDGNTTGDRSQDGSPQLSSSGGSSRMSPSSAGSSPGAALSDAVPLVDDPKAKWAGEESGKSSPAGSDGFPRANSPVPGPSASAADNRPRDSNAEYVLALHTFEGTDQDDLPFVKKSIIRVVEKVDEFWWRGELDGKEGLIPVTYVEPYKMP